jgi:hypothetical protein
MDRAGNPGAAPLVEVVKPGGAALVRIRRPRFRFVGHLTELTPLAGGEP